ncbi:tetratricopeptide repeat protein [Novosphingobium sp. ES2-1]|uniref:tetratricopeptide repeat protein n=1 Tax=Novosphingobium sp. ES2-1 TaxID=2780074 RepID=UPI001882AFB6|nr:tetratricopeptide repeat protein [Novosphingobium sp. ES2-1]QOV95072.1 tetratricopeptide repeat protein [Novosphingobium sp. ES2-1]
MTSRLALALLLALTGCGDDAAERVARAEREIAGMELGAAKVDLTAALADAGDDPAILRMLAAVQLRLGDGDGAAATASRLERSGGSQAELALIRAEAAVLRGNSDQALALLGQDASPAAERVRAAALSAKGDTAGAFAALQRGAASGGDPLLLRDYARFLIAAQDLDAASRQVEALSRLPAGKFDAALIRADIAVRRGQFAEAHAVLEQMAEKYPRVPDPWLARANAFDLQGKLDDALAMTSRAAAVAPDDPRVRDLQVQFASMKGEWDKVRSLLARQERDLDPLSANGLSYAEAMLRTGHPEQARAMFQRALTRSPNNPFARIMLAEAQLATGDSLAAFGTVKPLAASRLAGPRELELAVKAADAAGLPDATPLRGRLRAAQAGQAQSLAAEGQAALAREDWSAAAQAYAQLAQSGDDPEVLKRLALALSHAGKGEEAIRAADKARALRPEDPDTLYMAGLVRARTGTDLPTAITLLRKASSAEPTNAVFRNTLARYQAQTGA